jgi:hypothetical protein
MSNNLSSSIENLVGIWLSWMDTANHRNDIGVDIKDKRKMAEDGEKLIHQKYETVDTIDTFFEGLKEKKCT